MKMSPAEFLLSVQLQQAGIEHSMEFRPCESRQWRCDFVIQAAGLIVEVEGGTHQQGRHTRGEGFERDCEKYNWLVEQGWKVLRFTTGMVESNEAFEQIARMVGR